MKIIPVLIISILLAFNIYACTSETVCSKLNKTISFQSTLPICGCFDLVKVELGWNQGTMDAQDLKEAIIIHPDSSIEIYRQDTLAEIIPYNNNPEENIAIGMGTLTIHRFDYYRFRGSDTITYIPFGATDACQYLYVRKK